MSTPPGSRVPTVPHRCPATVRRRISRRIGAVALAIAGICVSAIAANESTAADAFYLKPGDRVCFYGDSITEQRYYGMDVETFVRTRFPDLTVDFVNSGVGGDKVSGGWAGAIDVRLERDVFPFHPTVVTIMLGMNDAAYHAFDAPVFERYQQGYEHIIESLQSHLPGVRIVLIEPTPYDDITQPPKFPGGYNAVLLKYAEFVRELAARHHLMCVDFMNPLLDVTKKAMAEDPALAGQILPGRIHPSAIGELVMAEALLKAWHAPAVVTSVTIDGAAHRAADTVNTTVADVTASDGGLKWTQQDRCLPFPVLGLHDKWPQFPPTERDWGAQTFLTPLPKRDWTKADPTAEMVLRLTDFYGEFDAEPLKVTGLADGEYTLAIDGQTIGKFTAAQLASGVNLAEQHTPMLEHAYAVRDLVWKQVAWRFFAWRGIQTQLAFDDDPAVQGAAKNLVAALEAQRERIVQDTYPAAKPKRTEYVLTPIR